MIGWAKVGSVAEFAVIDFGGNTVRTVLGKWPPNEAFDGDAPPFWACNSVG